MTARCPDCDRGWRHCHGTLVRHPDGGQECLADAACTGGPAEHLFVVDCVEIDCRCTAAPAR
ncbi:hypothetical protein [Actinocatenispora comari]|uniref:Uncharacterized protein n=1 Tax=Actinocatenispora comari TaxID=2807577 RepID=A0A8J4A8Q8_9ACTN|nr:hypothetical protein [Actinocatenispora comari]GIL26881.1 hypothetical protein NUM_21350 [Actinocatenispora comari]